MHHANAIRVQIQFIVLPNASATSPTRGACNEYGRWARIEWKFLFRGAAPPRGVYVNQSEAPCCPYHTRINTAHCSSNLEAKPSLTQDKLFIVLPCYNAAIGVTVSSGLTTLTVARVSTAGVVDVSTTWTSATAISMKTAASLDGSYFYIGTAVGLKGVAYGAAGVTGVAITTAAGSISTTEVVNNTLFASTVTSPYGVSKMYTVPLPTTSSSDTVISKIMSGTNTVGANHLTHHFTDVMDLYTAASGLTGTIGLLQRYSLVGSTWTMYANYPKSTIAYTDLLGAAQTAVGIKHMTGYRDSSTGRYMLAAVAYGAGNNGALLYVRAILPQT